ncbi:O-antigen/teichoic acid export membrane protein [Brevibacillus sp. AG162]|uniref:flippase n=1 Tax=Brevibacillus sp. AG162 TaxID=2572910 RepID=UPI00114EEE01|nr:flippase [Brevibacillus sp. AG162]TQK62365.1 O-antigen/teichoic acid export membrane protein [Brevibacillus sp. AG162]
MHALKLAWQREWSRLNKDRDVHEVIRGSAFTFLFRLLGFVLLYLLQFYIAREYGAKSLGIYSLTITLMNIGMVLAVLGTDTAMIRFLSEFRAKGSLYQISEVFNKVVLWTTLISIVLGVLLHVFSEQVSAYVFAGELPAEALRVVAWMLPFVSLARLYASAFRALHRVVISITVDIVGMRFLHLAFLISVIPFFEPSTMLLIQLLAAAVILNAVYGMGQWYATSRGFRNGVQPTTGEPGVGMREIIAVALPMYLSASMELIMTWTDMIMLGIFTDAKTVGVYSVVIRLAMVTGFALISINTILSPKFSELYARKDMDGLKKMIAFANRLIFFTSAPLNLLVAIFAVPLLTFFGEEFASESLVLVILCMGQFVNFCTGSVIPLLTMTGHQKTARNILVCSAALNIIGNACLIPLYGIIGAAIATSISLICRDLCASYWASKYFGFRTWYIPFLSEKYSVSISKTRS